MTPTARSMELLRKLDFIVAKVEQKIHGPKFMFSRDAFGFGDLLIARPGFGTALIQVTDGSSVVHRIKKIQGIAHDLTDEKQVADAVKANENAYHWLRSGNRIFVHGWAKRGPRGEKKKWVLREVELLIERDILISREHDCKQTDLPKDEARGKARRRLYV